MYWLEGVSDSVGPSTFDIDFNGYSFGATVRLILINLKISSCWIIFLNFFVET